MGSDGSCGHPKFTISMSRYDINGIRCCSMVTLVELPPPPILFVVDFLSCPNSRVKCLSAGGFLTLFNSLLFHGITPYCPLVVYFIV